jgi:hypothetical protein
MMVECKSQYMVGSVRALNGRQARLLYLNTLYRNPNLVGKLAANSLTPFDGLAYLQSLSHDVKSPTGINDHLELE